MIFVSYIKFKHGKLKRGERCLFRGVPATYLGTYVEKNHAVDLMRMDTVMTDDDVPVILEYVEQCTDRSQITCIAQQEPAIEGQLMLC